MGEWTSRRRVETTLRHGEPDRVPLDLTITIDAYSRLRSYLGLPPDTQMMDVDRMTEVRPKPDLLRVLGVDMTYVRLGKPSTWIPPRALPGVEWDEWGVGRTRVELPGGGSNAEVTHSPLSGRPASETSLDAYPWPDPTDPGYISGLAEDACRLYEETDLALMGRFGRGIMATSYYLRGYQEWMEDLTLEPDFARALLERVAEIMIGLDEAGLRAAGPYLSVLRVSGEDLGMQDRGLFSRGIWRGLIYPVLRRRWIAARRILNEVAPGCRLLLHSCGAIREYIPDLIEAGIEVIDPVQVHSAGMEPEALKRDFGDRLCFHGGVDTQAILPLGTRDDVRRETTRLIHALGPGGGYVLAAVHHVQSDVPPENLVTMFETARMVGCYPLAAPIG